MNFIEKDRKTGYRGKMALRSAAAAELSMACDIRLASVKAVFGQPEAGLGITPGFGGTEIIKIVGPTRRC